jgi:hypothetical protein
MSTAWEQGAAAATARIVAAMEARAEEWFEGAGGNKTSIECGNTLYNFADELRRSGEHEEGAG